MKRIDEMMKYYEWTADAEKSRPLSPEEQARILAKTLDKAGLSKGEPTYVKMAAAKPKGKEKGKEKMSRKKFLTIAVAAALCLSVAGVSAASLGLSDKFMEFLNPVDDKQAELVGSAGTVIDQKVTDNGMTIHVKEAIGDSNSVYVFYDVIAPEGVALDDGQYRFATERFQLEGAAGLGGWSGGWHFEQLPDEDPTDNVKSFVLCADASKKLQGAQMALIFENLCRYNSDQVDDPEDYDFVPVVEGNWDISFKLDYQDLSQTFKVNQEIAWEGEDGAVKADLKTLTLSPISVKLDFNGRTVDGRTLSADEMEQVMAGAVYQMPLAIHMKDGSVITEQQSGSSSSEGSSVTYIVSFPQLIDVDNVDYVEAAGVKVDIN